MIGAVVVAALLVVVGLYLLGNQGGVSNSPVETSEFPTLGAENAPVVMEEYSDYG